jgi:hypothetical protein
MGKREEREKRFLYIRTLERFLNQLVSFVSKEPSKEEFVAFVHLKFQPLEEVERVLVSNEYLKSLEAFVEQSANLIHSELDMEEIKQKILKEANSLRKIKRLNKYAKEKY